MPLLCYGERRSPDDDDDDEDEGEAESTSIWQQIPDSILLHIFSSLSLTDLCTVAEVCKTWHRVSLDETLWRLQFYHQTGLSGTPLAEGKLCWRDEVKRLYYHAPIILTEKLTQHTDEVLHVSFSHDGTMFSTTSKDATLKVWETGYPTRLKFSEDFRARLEWDFTQYSCFNSSDTMVLVSSVKSTDIIDRRGYMAILSITNNFEVLKVVTMDPSQLFGAWLDDNTFLGGSLEISLDRFATTVQIEAHQVEDNGSAETAPVLFTFCNESASLIKFLTVSLAPPDDDYCAQACTQSMQESSDLSDDRECIIGNEARNNSVKPKADYRSIVAEESDYGAQESVRIDDKLQEKLDMNYRVHSDSGIHFKYEEFPGLQQERNLQEESDKSFIDNNLHSSKGMEIEEMDSIVDSVNSPNIDKSIDSSMCYADENKSTPSNTSVRLRDSCKERAEIMELSVDTGDGRTGAMEFERCYMPVCEQCMKTMDLSTYEAKYYSVSNVKCFLCNSNTCNLTTGIQDGQDDLLKKRSHTSIDSRNFDSANKKHEDTCSPNIILPDSSNNNLACSTFEVEKTANTTRTIEDKLKNLIFVTGEFAVALHQLGFKNIVPTQRISALTADRSLLEHVGEEGYNMVVNYSNNDIHIIQRPQVADRPDHLIDLQGHVTGLCLTSDHRYLFINCRPWVGEIDRSDPWATPELSPDIQVRIIDLRTLRDVGVKFTGHKGYSPSNMCCFVFLDVSADYVASGSEDAKGYLWDRHYHCLLGNYEHDSGVVNAVAFSPTNQEYLVTASDDMTLKVWRSRSEVRKLGIKPYGATYDQGSQ